MSPANRPTDASPEWAALHQPAEIADALIGLYRRLGHDRAETSGVTIGEHACQAAAYALAAGAPDPLVVAALFHDIGHLLLGPGSALRASAEPAHEVVGADFLARWFDQKVTAPVRLHVAAKRYLCAVDPYYEATLTSASARSLIIQGGPLSPDELARFVFEAGGADAIELRRWDDLAHRPGTPAPSLDVYQQMVEVLLTDQRRQRTRHRTRPVASATPAEPRR
ncbi:MAG: HD domain-containing protein [Acidimicrobiia bacterium]|nr:HD domain-containing protein [Acidimicrobiia bacterium]MDH4363964.1 HD domain-containing protein [Acidimicrobiia bacterium]MDH5291379.1 HD domain-containing protein [Acidimicrobiia bacterium]